MNKNVYGSLMMLICTMHGNKFSQTPSFCEQCRKFLNGKGWTIK